MGRALRWGATGIAIVLALAIAVPFLVPLSPFLPELAATASAKLNQPVAIEELSLHILPTPRLVARGLRIGRHREVNVGELQIVPDLLSLVWGPRALREIRLHDVELQEAAFGIPRGMAKGGGGGEAVRVRRLVLTAVTLHHPSVRLPPFDAEVRLGDDFAIEEARFASRDGTVELQVQPKSAGLAVVSLRAKNWTLPAGAPLLFEALAADGVLKGSDLELAKVRGKLYGGEIEGHARADWTKQWQLSGRARITGVDLVPVQMALGKAPNLSGRLNAEASFAARARKPAQLGEALSLDGPFEVIGGAYQGVDLSKAADITGTPAVGDATIFEEMRGKLQLRGRQVNLNELCVRSPKVVAGGAIEIAPDQKLSGKLDVSVAKTAGFVGVPVSLGGTTSDPTVRPTKGYVIGAVIGTVLLPGIGTTLGASAGSRFEGSSSACK